MTFELTYTDGDLIDQFDTREEALAKAAAMLGVRIVIEGPALPNWPGGTLTGLYMSRAQRDANNARLVLFAFEDSEA